MPDRLSHYQLLEIVGTGGMGTVFRALDESNGQTVAVKTLHPHLSRDSDYVRRFEREARTAESIDSPDVVKVLGAGREGGTLFLVMEYVEGQTLADYINQNGSLSVSETVAITAGIARGLAAAHASSVVHRDISPQNVMITRDGRAKVTDFGVARDLSQATLTATSILMGKPLYIAPEVVTGASRADIRADIYALGIITFQMLVGEAPFNADTPYAVMQKHVNEAIPSLHTCRAGLPEWLVMLVERCLAKDPTARYQTPSEVLTAIEVAELVPTIRLELPAQPTVRLRREDVQADEATPAKITASLQTIRGRIGGRRGEYLLVLRNEGNAPVSLSIEGSDQAKALSFNLLNHLALEPEETKTVSVGVRRRSKRLVGRKRRWPFVLTALGSGGNNAGALVSVNGDFEEAPPWPLFVGAGVLGAAILAFLVLSLTNRTPEAQAVVAAAAGSTATQTVVAPPTTTQSLAASPTPSLTAVAVITPAPPPDRFECNAIRGTGYRSQSERQWFNRNCPLSPVAPTQSPGSSQVAAPRVTYISDIGFSSDTATLPNRPYSLWTPSGGTLQTRVVNGSCDFNYLKVAWVVQLDRPTHPYSPDDRMTNLFVWTMPDGRQNSERGSYGPGMPTQIDRVGVEGILYEWQLSAPTGTSLPFGRYSITIFQQDGTQLVTSTVVVKPC